VDDDVGAVLYVTEDDVEDPLYSDCNDSEGGAGGNEDWEPELELDDDRLIMDDSFFVFLGKLKLRKFSQHNVVYGLYGF
jgi:hypothetical protein